MTRVYLWGDPDRFHNYSRAVTAAGGAVQFGGAPAMCHGLLLPGGGDMEPWRYGQENTASRALEPARDAKELELLEEFLRQGKPVLGICRGLQVINVFFGGTLLQDLEGHCAVGGQDRFHAVRTAAVPWGAPVRDIVNSAHHQAVDVLGDGLEAVQWAPDGTVEAVCHRSLPVWGVQWHPERIPEPFGGNLLGWFLSRCAPEKNIRKMRE